MKAIEDVKFDNFESFAERIVDEVLGLEDCQMVEVFGYFEDIETLMRELLTYDDVSTSLINITSEETDNYGDEYSLSLNVYGDLAVEPARRNGHILGYDGNVVFISNDCHTSLLDKNLCKSPIIYAYDVDGDYEYDDDSDECICDCYECQGYVDTKSVSKDEDVKISLTINDKPVDIKEFCETINKIDDRFVRVPMRHYSLLDNLFRW